MTPLMIIGLLLLGAAAGYLSGLVGIGGGIIIVPVLVFAFGFTQHQAQGTTLALLVPPIGLLAAMEYYRKGHVNLAVAGLIIVGFVLGSWLGGKTATSIPDVVLKRIFAVVMVLVAAKMLLSK